MYKLENTSTVTPRYVYSKSGRGYNIMPGKSAVVDLPEKVAERLVQNSKAGSELKVTSVGVQIKEIKQKVSSKSKPDEEANVVQTEDDFKTPAEALIEEADHLNFGIFVSKAKRLMGDRYPEGRLKKDEIIEALRGFQ